MIQYFLINTLFPVLTAILLYVFLNRNFHYSIPKIKLTLFISLFGIGNGIISTLWINIFDMTSILQMFKPLIVLIFSISLIKTILKIDWLRTITSFLLIFVALGMGNIVAPVILNAFGLNLTTKTISESSLLYLISNLSTFVVALGLVLITPRLLEFKRIKNLNPVLGLFCITIVIMIIMSQTFGSDSNVIIFVILITILVVSYAFMLVSYNAQQKKKDLEEEIRQQEFYNRSLQKTLLELRAIKHDTINHNETLKIMLEKGNLKEAIWYLNELQTTVANVNTGIYNIKNVAIHAIISAKFAKAEKAGIKFLFSSVGEIDIIEEVKVSDLCEFLGILLDNAIEAALDTDEKIVEFQIVVYPNLIEIKLSNSCKEEFDIEKIKSDGYSTKGTNRGHGLAIAEHILKKYKHVISNETYFFDELMRYEQIIKIKKTPD